MAFYVARALGLNTHAAAGDTPGGALVAHGGGSGAVAAALAAAEAAAEVEVPWSSRAAALSYCQMLWFRHSTLMSPQQLARLQVGAAGGRRLYVCVSRTPASMCTLPRTDSTENVLSVHVT